MSLRARLLLLSLLTLVLPWAGCQYARQMEAVLSKGQGDALLATARVLETVVAADPALHATPTDTAATTVFATQLLTYELDGFPDEWPPPARPLPIADNSTRTLRLGIYGSAIVAFLRVTDASVIYDAPPDADSRASRRAVRADRVLLLTGDHEQVERAWVLSAVAPGPLVVRRAQLVQPWTPTDEDEIEIRGVWRATADGYDIEVRIPRRLLGNSLALVAVPHDEPPPTPIALHPLRVASESLRETLQRYAPEGVRVSLVDAQGWLLARAGSLASTTNDDELPSIYRWMLARDERIPPPYGIPYGIWGPPVDAALTGRPTALWFAASGGDPSTVRAAVPIAQDGKVAGAILVEQAGEQLLHERDAALTGLFNFALLATVLTVLATLAFAAWTSRRIRRLSIAAATALTPEGRIEPRLPDTGARDELGDLSRSFASLLKRINDYAAYLQTLGSKLSHEFRTPLAIVSSSLDNLNAEHGDPAKQAQFIARAREGTERLQAILSAMTEATRVEQSIEQADRTLFDLAALVRDMVSAYQQTFATHRILARVPEAACPLRGAPDLIAQLLDKLVDNAIDFSPARGQIVIEVGVEPKHYRLSVSNEGPLLPPDAEHKIFDLLMSQRAGGSGKPHLGLGLYIVKLIARFHGGEVIARNLPDATGVSFDVRLARNTE